MKTYYQLTCELYTPHVVPVLNAKQYDTGRGVDITLTDCGAVVVPSAGENLTLYCKRPDGAVSYLPATLSGSAVRVDFTNTMLSEEGVVECELQIGAGDTMVSTPVFRLVVLPSNYDAGAIESSDEFGALEEALATVNQYDTRIAAIESSMKTEPFTHGGFLSSSDDLDTVPAGAYYCNNAVQNIPVNTGGFVVTFVRTGNAKAQLYLPAASGYTLSIYKRQYVASTSTWTAWTAITGTAVS